MSRNTFQTKLSRIRIPKKYWFTWMKPRFDLCLFGVNNSLHYCKLQLLNFIDIGPISNTKIPKNVSEGWDGFANSYCANIQIAPNILETRRLLLLSVSLTHRSLRTGNNPSCFFFLSLDLMFFKKRKEIPEQHI